MKSLSLFVLAMSCAFGIFVSGCGQKDNFAGFLASEIGSLGGKSNSLKGADMPVGRWTVKHDQFGAAIDTEGIGFEPITNMLTSAFGAPQFYSAANDRHGTTYLYPYTNAGIAIFVSSTKAGAEVTLTKPLGKAP
jgi:hypothetical protein